MDLELVIKGYIEALFWAECNEDTNLSSDLDLDQVIQDQIKADCQKFLELADPILMDSHYESAQVGHDFFLSRRHLGGFSEHNFCTKKQAIELDKLTQNNFKDYNDFFELNGKLYAE